MAEVRSGSYSCRSRNSQRGARLSEHAFGNAVDVMAFRFADGREVSVVRGWRGAPEEQEFLREVFVGACGYFNTVLGPGADVFHHDHFHLDLARHDPRGQRHICKPILKFTPRLGDDACGRSASRPAGAQRRWSQRRSTSKRTTTRSRSRQAGAADDLSSSPPPAPAPQASSRGSTLPRPPRAAGLPADAATPRQPMVLQPQLWTGSPIY